MKKFTLIIMALVLLLAGCSRKADAALPDNVSENINPEGSGKSFSYDRNTDSAVAADVQILAEIHDNDVIYNLGNSQKNSMTIRVHELTGSEWVTIKSLAVSFTDPLTVRINGGNATETAFYEVEKDSELVISTDVNEMKVVILVPLRLEGVLTAGYIIVSPQRNVIDGFNEKYYHDPHLLPEGTYEIFAVELELH